MIRGLRIAPQRSTVPQALEIFRRVVAVTVFVTPGFGEPPSLPLPKPLGGEAELAGGFRDAEDLWLLLHARMLGGMGLLLDRGTIR